MKSEMLKTVETSTSDALVKIKVLEQQVQQEGNVDSEISLFEEIMRKLLSNELTPNEAIIQAQNIIDRRQNYH